MNQSIIVVELSAFFFFVHFPFPQAKMMEILQSSAVLHTTFLNIVIFVMMAFVILLFLMIVNTVDGSRVCKVMQGINSSMSDRCLP